MKPFRLHVGPVAYDVCTEDRLKDGHGTEIAGLVQHDSEQVRVDGVLPKRSQHITVLHELVHTIFQQAGQREWYELENLLDCLAYGLAGTEIADVDGNREALLAPLFAIMEDE